MKWISMTTTILMVSVFSDSRLAKGVNPSLYFFIDQQDTMDPSREPRQNGPSQQYLAGNALTIQSFDVMPWPLYIDRLAKIPLSTIMSQL